MKGQKLVIVESPTKARTVRRFLGKEYIVESCMGHIRDLPQSARDIPKKYKDEHWASLGVNVDKAFAPVYCIPNNKLKVVKLLKDQLRGASELILATDEDREGESISWHLVEVLQPKVPVKRMVFHEITKEAILESLKSFRDIDENLVRAQEARRILDRLVGYTISPLLWKKVAYGLSAGRVQSVAVKLIVERELKRLDFKKSDYWSLQGQCEKKKATFDIRVTHYEDKVFAVGKDFDPDTGKLKKDFENRWVLDKKTANEILSNIQGKNWTVFSVEEKQIHRQPPIPFITSTLQQEASRKMGWAARETMQVAQKLYEQGYITYMRTDSPQLSDQAVKASRKSVEKLFGKKYLSEHPLNFAKKKVKGAQEAHEAIRPAGASFSKPEELKLKGGQAQLYELIWRRTLASQMAESLQKQVSVKLKTGKAQAQASGTTIEFDGYLKVYATTEKKQSSGSVLPKLAKGDDVSCKKIDALSHETKPPARYTEASLIQTLEKEGIGRPSTYAVIMTTIQSRGYVKKSGNMLAPTFTAMIVSNLLKNHLPRYVDPKFTSQMEGSLDEIAQGDRDWQKYLNNIYFGKEGLKTSVEEQEKKITGNEARSMELKTLKGLSFRVGRYGAYVCQKDEVGNDVCASLPESKFPSDLTKKEIEQLIETRQKGADALGQDKKTGLSVYVLNGRFGPYVQLGENEEEKKEKPKRTSIPDTINYEEITLEQALDLLSLPKTLGNHPETGLEVKKGLGRFGPYILHNKEFRSIPKSDDLFTVELKRALEIISQPKKGFRRKALKELGTHPELSKDVSVFDGKFGPYIKCGSVNISLPDEMTPEKVTLEQAVELLSTKINSLGQKKKKTASRRKKTTSSSRRQSKASPPPARSSSPQRIIRRSSETT